MKHLSQTLKAGLAALLILAAQAIMPSQAAFAAPGGQLQQVFCNVEGRSGKWKAQIGGQSTKHEYPLLNNSQFVYVHNQNEVTDAMDTQCQTQYGTQTIPIPATPAVNDPCGPRNATWVIPGDTASIHWLLDGQNHLIATAQMGYIFSDHSDRTTTHDFGVAVDTNADCVIVKPQQTMNDPCGTNNATWTIATSSYYTIKQNLDRSVTITTIAGYAFAGGVKSYTIPAPTDTNALCSSEPIPTPQPVDPCGLNNAYWVKPRNTQTVHWSIDTKGELIATAVGVNFTDHTSSINFGLAKDSGNLCLVDMPKQPEPKDPCGVNNATWELPSNTKEYTWSLINGHLIVTTTANYTFSDGVTHDYGLAGDSGQLCPVTIVQPTCNTDGSITLTLPDHHFVQYYYEVTIGIAPPVKYTQDTTITGIKQGTVVHVKLVRDGYFIDIVFKKDYTFDMLSCIKIPSDPSPVVDPCGPNNATWGEIKNTDTITWSIVNGRLIATAVGSLFTDGQPTHDYGVAKDSKELCAPTPPTVEVFCGLYTNDQVILPETGESDHYSWSVERDGDTLVVTVTPDEGYWFGEDVTTEWTFVDTHTACTMPPLQTTPKTCRADATVTVEYNTERYYYTIQLGDGEENPLDSGTTTLAEVGTYTVRGYEYRYSNDERIMIDEEDGVAFTETFTVTAPSCEPGKGSITPLPSPIELPHTGSDGLSNLLVALVSAAAVYGAVYFAQPRRS